ncbi:DUF2313 domain-containing protein [Clostridiaceae bacterium M8S5]|nr:DUF2313 domain-containing protein [Clostridiaceae bacterium M8S5]
MNNLLMKHLPDYYRVSGVMTNITGTQNSELIEFKEKLEKVANQFFVDTSDYGLDRWEKDLGIISETNKPNELRKQVILSKLKGVGSITVKLLEEVAQTYDRKIEVIEESNKYHFKIKFVDIKGVPPNENDLRKVIEDIKPAHLSFEFEYVYNTWKRASVETWQSASQYTWENIRTI